MVAGILAGVFGALGGLGLGLGAGGGGFNLDFFRGVEVGTSKKEISIVEQETFTYAPQITKTIDITTATGQAQITQKKEQMISPAQTITPILTAIPTQLQGAGQVGGAGLGAGAGGGLNLSTILIIGSLGLGGYYLFKKK